MNSTFNIAPSKSGSTSDVLAFCLHESWFSPNVSFDTVEDVWSILFIGINNVAIAL